MAGVTCTYRSALCHPQLKMYHHRKRDGQRLRQPLRHAAFTRGARHLVAHLHDSGSFAASAVSAGYERLGRSAGAHGFELWACCTCCSPARAPRVDAFAVSKHETQTRRISVDCDHGGLVTDVLDRAVAKIAAAGGRIRARTRPPTQPFMSRSRRTHSDCRRGCARMHAGSAGGFGRAGRPKPSLGIMYHR